MRTAIRTDDPLQDDHALSAYGRARSGVEGAPLSPEELRKIDEYWRASLYLCSGCYTSRTTPCSKRHSRSSTSSHAYWVTGGPNLTEH